MNYYMMSPVGYLQADSIPSSLLKIEIIGPLICYFIHNTEKPSVNTGEIMKLLPVSIQCSYYN
ncbi:hypothetical protein A4R26_05235 [Niastella populi]|uniref:Uncharacterized protein n=1 Tax=Niastella populi TaxID=550983 RepID=A0A1V9FED4_9BACT|nr:hypothetical protein A4R26_05235 [Niastella populi]